MKKVILSVTNDLITDQRVDKVANSLTKNGFDVLLIGRLQNKSNILDKRKYAIHRLNLVFNRGFLFYFEFNLRLFFFLLRNKSNILVSNDLDTLLPNFLVSKIKKVKLIYDSHELFTEVPELLNRNLVQKTWLFIEKICLKHIENAYTVSDSIAQYYNNKYGINMIVVRNVPIFRKTMVNQTDNNYKKIIYQGAINKDRGIDLMISSMRYIHNAKLYIVGGGDLLSKMIQYATKLNLQNKVVFLGKMHFNELFSITQSADLGLSFENDTCLAYKYSLPNKIFDYMNAEIPVLISDLPEFKSIMKNYNLGMILQSRDPQHISTQINELLSIPKEKWLSEISRAKKNFCWENEEKKLLSLFV